jgi:hypothetical protein
MSYNDGPVDAINMAIGEMNKLKEENKKLLEAVSKAYDIMREDTNPCECDDCLVVKRDMEKWLDWCKQYLCSDKSS